MCSNHGCIKQKTEEEKNCNCASHDLESIITYVKRVICYVHVTFFIILNLTMPNSVKKKKKNLRKYKTIIYKSALRIFVVSDTKRQSSCYSIHIYYLQSRDLSDFFHFFLLLSTDNLISESFKCANAARILFSYHYIMHHTEPFYNHVQILTANLHPLLRTLSRGNCKISVQTLSVEIPHATLQFGQTRLMLINS